MTTPRPGQPTPPPADTVAEPRESIGARAFTGLIVGAAMAVGAAGNALYALADVARAVRALGGRRR